MEDRNLHENKQQILTIISISILLLRYKLATYLLSIYPVSKGIELGIWDYYYYLDMFCLAVALQAILCTQNNAWSVKGKHAMKIWSFFISSIIIFIYNDIIDRLFFDCNSVTINDISSICLVIGLLIYKLRKWKKLGF